MRAFKVYLNGTKVALAGIDRGVLTAIVSCVTGDGREELSVEVGGLDREFDQHISWLRDHNLRVGDEIRVKIVEAKSIDEPKNKSRVNPVGDLQAQKSYVRRMAKQFG
jgi:hypothetical protein